MLKKASVLAILIAFTISFLSYVSDAKAYTASDAKRAHKYHAQKSYFMAATEYEKLMAQKTSNKKLAREVAFKWADSLVKSKNNRKMDKALRKLEEIANGKDKDLWKIEAGVSLAEHYIKNNPWQKRQQVKKWLEDAREYWAGSSDIKLARVKFIDISFMLADYVTSQNGWYNTNIRKVSLDGSKHMKIIPTPHGNSGLKMLFMEVLKIAKDDNDKARAYFGLAMMEKNTRSGYKDAEKVIVENFEKIIDDYGKTEWADDAWYNLAQFYENRNKLPLAVKTYQAFIKKFSRGQSKWVNDAQRRIKRITSPSLSMSVSNTFVSGSQVRFHMNWRNMSYANMTLYKLDMGRELGVRDENNNRNVYSYRDLLNRLVEKSGRYRNLPVQARWTAQLKNENKHNSHSAYKGLAEWRKQKEKDDVNPKLGRLPDGAYLLMAVGANGKRAYDLVLVSDIALVTKISKGTALFLAMDAKTGKPLPNTNISYNYSWYQQNRGTQWSVGQGRTGTDGVLMAELKTDTSGRQNYQQHDVFAVASGAGNKQAFVRSNYYRNSHNNKGEWWLYSFTDRPAYRPNEVVSFKGIIRNPEHGSFMNPAGMQVKARIYDAQGKQVKEGVYRLNAYGAFADTFTLDDKATLGEYRLTIYNAKNNNQIANASLFRLEEYKLPEFVVNVKAKENEDGQSIYRLGDKLEVEIDAKYYFGGAVSNADVEYLVYQQAYNHHYAPVKPYHWYYEDMRVQHYNYGGHGALITQKKIKTDKDGKASFTIETPKGHNQDLKYHIEARVVDKSRREIRSTSDIKVTKNAFFVHMEPQQHLYRPGDKVKFNIKTMTVNEAPVPVEGKITIKRNSWRDPVYGKGRAVKHPGGYNGQELFTKFVTTDAKGEAVFTFEPNDNGYYVAEFTGFDKGNEVKGHTRVFVSDNSAKNIGYRYSGLEIITEKDTYAVGETARAMIVSEKPKTWVLFTQESNELYNYKMLYLDNSVKLVEVPITKNYTPNVFFHAVSGANFQLKTTAQQIIVPPDDKFLNVKIVSDKKVYQPREDGVFDVTITDKNGRPVVGEVALGLVDASVYYIQKDYAQDIRKFFYGDKRPQSIQTQASFYQRSYINLVHDKNNNLITEAEALRRNSERDLREKEDSNEYGQAKGQSFLDKDGGARFRQEGIVGGGMAAPAASMAMAEEMVAADMAVASSFENKKVARKQKAAEGRVGAKNGALGMEGDDAGVDESQVRNDFRSTIHWQPFVVTDHKGRARIKVKFPDSLTTWRMTARAMTADTSVGNVTHEVQSNKELMIRLQAPRFFTVRDLTAVSALIDNMSDKEITVRPRIKTEGLVVTGIYKDGQFMKGEINAVKLPAGGQTRVDWAVSAQEEGEAKIMVSAKGGKLSDAMRKTYPVLPHGIEKFVAESVVLKGEGSHVKEFTVNIPKERIKETTSLRLNLSPSLAANMLDALPYLAQYPYGCVEQTMSRFLPAAVVHQTMRETGISKSDVDTYINNVLAMRDDPKHPKKSTKQTHSELDKMVGDGLKRLYDFQHSDGGWGWWKTDDSDRFMTAYVVWGLGIAKKSGVEIKQLTIEKAKRFLQLELVEAEDQPDMLAWILHALAEVDSRSKFENKQRDRLWKMRNELNPYTRALFALSEHKRGHEERSKILAENALNGVLEDKENGTAHWGESGVHYRWSEGGVEATAFVIKALSQIDPDSPYLDKAVKWLTLNRRGGRWKNTRDTAISILGLADYLKATRELAPDYTYQVVLNGETIRQGKINASNVFSFNRIVDVPADKLRDGANKVKIVMQGKGSLYVAAHAKFFTLEEDITKEGNEVFVDRKYYIKSVKETLMKGYTQDWKELKSGDEVKSGDRIRVDIHLEAKNHYEYLLTEDYKPAGLEAVSLISGRGYALTLDHEGRETGAQTPLYQEFRDEKAAFFISKLKQGKHIIRYELRAEIPGQFHAMPNMAHAMYVPEIRANSDEMRITVNDKTE